MEETYIVEFLIHEATTRILHIAKPAVSIRFLQFPTLTIYGQFQGKLQFGKGKACKFVLDEKILRTALRKTPLYVMLIDAFPQNIRMLGTAALDLSVFADIEFTTSSDFKRSIIDLYDPIRNAIGKLDLSISISILNKNPEIEGKPADGIFQNITQEMINKIPDELKVNKAIETDPVPPIYKTASSLVTRGTMTQEEKPEPKETQTPLFGDTYQPPPMFFSKTKPTSKTSSTSYEEPVIQPQKQSTQHIPPPQPTGLLIDHLIQEVQLLKGASSLNQQWSYPPLMQFDKPKTQKMFTTTTNVDNLTIKPIVKTLKISAQESIKESQKESEDHYSEDFEENSSVPQSSERSVKCFVCGEMVKVSEAGDHPKVCKSARSRTVSVVSPREESSEGWKELTKSVTQSSIVEEYDSDFEDESDR